MGRSTRKISLQPGERVQLASYAGAYAFRFQILWLGLGLGFRCYHFFAETELPEELNATGFIVAAIKRASPSAKCVQVWGPKYSSWRGLWGEVGGGGVTYRVLSIII
eukprot:4328954-Pyramimonas_sp.AAC.1